MSLLRAERLRVRVGGRTLLDGLDLAVEAGTVWAVLGRNGAGKTTLLHTLAGLRPAAAGCIHLNGEPLAAWSRRAIARRIGLLPQDNHDPFPATVLETALIGRHPHLEPWRWEDRTDRDLALDALRLVGLETFAARDVGSLSGGERRRLAMATLLTQDPGLMLLDEPSNHLDLHHQVQLLGLLSERNRSPGRGALMTLHDVNLADRFCTHALLLFPDAPPLAGPCGEVLNEGTLTQLYGHPIRKLHDRDRRAFLAD